MKGGGHKSVKHEANFSTVWGETHTSEKKSRVTVAFPALPTWKWEYRTRGGGVGEEPLGEELTT